MRNLFGELLRRLRKEAGVTGTQVAKALEVSASYLHDVEKGRRLPPDIFKILKLAELLRTDPDPLILAAAHERGYVEIKSSDPLVLDTAVRFAAWSEVASKEQLEKLRSFLDTELRRLKE